MTDWVWVPFDVERQFDGYRVDRFLSQRLTAYSRARIQRILEDSRVMREERRIKASTRVYSGQRILIAYPRRVEIPLEDKASLPILYEDDSYIAINKPGDLLSHPTDKVMLRTVVGILRHSRPDLESIHLLHRLDRETSGVLVLGKNAHAARAWSRIMEQRQVRKQYLAFARGVPQQRAGLIEFPIGRQGGEIHVRQAIHVPGAVQAATRYRVEQAASDVAVIRAYPETGRLHQIRVHLAAIGHPILGDALYTGDGSIYLKMTRNQLAPGERNVLGFPRLALHAAQIEFQQPISLQALRIAAPLPQDMQDFLRDKRLVKLIN